MRAKLGATVVVLHPSSPDTLRRFGFRKLQHFSHAVDLDLQALLRSFQPRRYKLRSDSRRRQQEEEREEEDPPAAEEEDPPLCYEAQGTTSWEESGCCDLVYKAVTQVHAETKVPLEIGDLTEFRDGEGEPQKYRFVVGPRRAPLEADTAPAVSRAHAPLRLTARLALHGSLVGHALGLQQLHLRAGDDVAENRRSTKSAGTADVNR